MTIRTQPCLAVLVAILLACRQPVNSVSTSTPPLAEYPAASTPTPPPYP